MGWIGLSRVGGIAVASGSPLMVNVRSESRQVRFNVLLTEDREHAIEHWTRQLPRLLEPQGVHAYVARTGREALQMAESMEVHAAVIDLLTPAGSEGKMVGQPRGAGGLWLLEVFRRLPQRPPVVVVNNRAYTNAQAHRLLNEALRLGAFSVINPPVELEALLAVIRRLVDRRYAGAWPERRPAPGEQAPGRTQSGAQPGAADPTLRTRRTDLPGTA